MLKEKILTDSEAPAGNRYNLAEWAGAFGDLGTLIPFIVAYITVLKFDPTAILLVFGLSMIASGLYYKTPIPVQPMKAIGAVAITHAGVTQGMVGWAALITGVLWLFFSLTGIIRYVARLAGKPLVTGIIIALGLTFAREALKMMSTGPVPAAVGVILTFILLRGKKIPALFILLALGLIYAFITTPGLTGDLSRIRFNLHLPEMSFARLRPAELIPALLLLALPQIPLTIGNGVLAITAENNRLFPERAVREEKIAMSTGIMNLLATLIGGVPVCHGAGGMAGHVRFGAKTGGSVVILGVILTVLALFFGSSVLIIFGVLPRAILGVILFFAGLELLQVYKKISRDFREICVVATTAIVSLYNPGVGFLAGLALYYTLKPRNAVGAEG